MPGDNVDLIRRYYAHLAETGEPLWELHAPEIAFDVTDVMPDAEVLRGREAVGAALRAYADTFEDFQIELEEIVAADEDHVVTAVRDGGRIKGSDAVIENRFFHAWTIREGKIVRWSSHLSQAAAVDSVGLAQ
ncbi:MAG: nuclear transport factor 2 family protein [Actinomycetota bacterium]|nr:nuclear transport factor 2 family protein [Actinomycetota bacterium]